jgi:SAM-dependent methyltransferase
VVFSKDAMVHIEDKAALYAEVLRVLKPGGRFTAADWLWARAHPKSPVVNAWFSKDLSSSHLLRLRCRRLLMRGSQNAVWETYASACNKPTGMRSKRWKGLRARNGIDRGERHGRQSLGQHEGRQAAPDSGDLIPTHLRGRRPR